MDDDGQRGEAEKKKRTIFGWYGQPCHDIVVMKRRRLLTILIRHVDSITDSVLILGRGRRWTERREGEENNIMLDGTETAEERAEAGSKEST